MLTGFFLHLKSFRLPVSTREFLTLLEALDKRVVSSSLDDFYVLARACLVKDEQHFDRFDLAFGSYFKGVDALFDIRADIPDEWLRRRARAHLSDEDKRAVEALGGLDKLLETFRQRLAEQRERHQGGSKWIGTGGTSPFGAYGFNPEGMRVGAGRAARAARSRSGTSAVFAISTATSSSIRATSRSRCAGCAASRAKACPRSSISTGPSRDGAQRRLARSRLQPERRNRVKVLLFLDVGGSMDPHVEAVRGAVLRGEVGVPSPRALLLPQLHLRPRVARQRATAQRARQHARTVMRTYGPDWKVIFVGDAAMNPYELTQIDGSAEYRNLEPGIAWLAAALRALPPRRLVESGAGADVGVHAHDADDPAGARAADVSADARRDIAQGIDALRH